MTLQAPIPLLRIFDPALAKAFYCDGLGFEGVMEVTDPFGNRIFFNQPLPEPQS